MIRDQKQVSHRPKFYGTTVVGERGQAVIPAEARKALGLKQGDKLLVFGMRGGMVSFSKFSQFEQFAKNLSKRVKIMKSFIEKNKNK